MQLRPAARRFEFSCVERDRLEGLRTIERWHVCHTLQHCTS
ncbi:hypothetical protein SO694_00041211 [Aureococcus anophagefferens]|uniref:Uncharacterized protein n=1 Tax=Aureococcus anophagefferens TaxID=44056 RepID=A0ABR1G685_AURAN